MARPSKSSTDQLTPMELQKISKLLVNVSTALASAPLPNLEPLRVTTESSILTTPTTPWSTDVRICLVTRWSSCGFYPEHLKLLIHTSLRPINHWPNISPTSLLTCLTRPSRVLDVTTPQIPHQNEYSYLCFNINHLYI